MMSDALTNEGKHRHKSNISCVRSQPNTNDSFLIGPNDIICYDVM